MVIPVGDVNPTHRRAVLTFLLVAANVAVFFLLQPAEGGCVQLRFLYRWAAVPPELLSFDQLDPASLPGSAASCLRGLDKNVPLSALTAMFLHADILHLGGNMLFLWVFGNNVEDRLGRLQFLVFYVVGGLVATYAFAFLNADDPAPLLGASGAVAAVLGAYLVMFPKARVRTYAPFPIYLLAWLLRFRVVLWLLFFAIVEFPAWLVLGFWFLIQLRGSSSPVAQQVAFSAHVAGFVAGVVLTFLLNGTRSKPRPRTHAWDPSTY